MYRRNFRTNGENPLGLRLATEPAHFEFTDMHYRIGGIAETFMSTLLLMLVEQGRIRSLAEMCRTKTEKCLF